VQYKIGATKAIHWDRDGIHKITPNGKIQWIVTADIFAVHEGQLPVILVANPTVLENGIAVWSAIFHTKTILSFSPVEEPINEIIKMWDECYLQETKLLRELGRGSILEVFELGKIKNPAFNSSYSIREAAIERNLVTIPPEGL
jgi:hypothetical protein